MLHPDTSHISYPHQPLASMWVIALHYLLCNRTHPYPVTLLSTGSGHFRAKPFSPMNTPTFLNPLNPELNPICYLLALLAHHFLHVSRIRVKSLTLRLLMSYIYMEHLFLMFLDHTRRSTVGRTPLDE